MKFVIGLTGLLLSLTALAAPLVEVYKSPTCGCCAKWVEHLEQNGFEVKVHETENLYPIKQKANIPAGKGSCHTAFVDGYVVEGHVPAADIKRLLKERSDARGLVVPGMPAGSPGMEMGPHQEAYDVLLFEKDGDTKVFNRYPASR